MILDCRFSIADTEAGRTAYLKGHIPGAVYAHLDEDGSGSLIAGETGRHPLPEPMALAQTFSRMGIGASSQVVVYDDMGGAIAARFWFLLHWLGHESVAVLDGGLQQWVKGSRPLRAGVESRSPQDFIAKPKPEKIVSTSQVGNMLGNSKYCLMDARGFDRYCGENETIDPVAGHIPSARSVPFPGNLDESGCFLSPEQLLKRYQKLVAKIPLEQTIVYCGSGVTAAHNLLALAHAGLGAAKCYVGSWSEWITDPNRPVATGPNP